MQPFGFRNSHPCRSELAREERHNTAFIQTARVFIGVHRERARSYRFYGFTYI
jgi:hypothetical protein